MGFVQTHKQPKGIGPSTVKPDSRGRDQLEPDAKSQAFRMRTASYIASWIVGDMVEWGGSKWEVAELQGSSAVLRSGSIRLTVTIA